jgi:hypothetical protein
MIDMLAALAELKKTVERLEELTAWDELKEMSGPSAAIPFWQINGQIKDEIRDLYGLFCQLDQSLRQALNDPHLAGSAGNRVSWRHGLRELEERVRKLHVPETFINR